MSVHKPFKATERALAKRLGGVRIGHLGGADVVTNWLAVECKHRKTVPAWLKDALAQSRRNAGVSQLPVAIIHEAGTRHSSDLVVMSLQSFQDWFVDAQPGGSLDDAIEDAAAGDEGAIAWVQTVAPDRS